jgi:hypothetical protein
MLVAMMPMVGMVGLRLWMGKMMMMMMDGGKVVVMGDCAGHCMAGHSHSPKWKEHPVPFWKAQPASTVFVANLG